MSVWKVYSKDGNIERCELHAVEYGGTYMGERAVTATFTSPCEIEFGIFDYIIYRDEKFEIEAIPTVKKVSSFEYIYELCFVSLKYELERCEMRDLVPYDNDVVYPTPLTFSFTGNVRYLTERIQACLDSLYGDGVWNIVVGDGVESEEKNVTIAQQNCWNALALVNSIYGLDFHIKGRTIIIGETLPLVGHVFEYGKGNGLYEIERASDTDTGIVTKLRAFGGTRNLDYSYPKRPEWTDSVLPVSFAFSPLRLMLPSFKKDGKTDYILADADVIARYGVREASIIYEDIYPSITGATHNGQAIDRIKSVEAVDDNSGTFVVHLYDLGFDLEEHLTTGDAQISMRTGAMQGYTFTIAKIEKDYAVVESRVADENQQPVDPDNPVDSDNPNNETEEEKGEFIGYKITLNRISAEGGENYNIPNSAWSMKAGDEFVLLNILMPQKYIRNAENRLQSRAEEYLEQYSKTNFSYNIGLHDKFLMENPSVYESLIEGSKLKVYDKELGVNEEVAIQSITITENAEDNILPQVKVVLNNKPSASTLERIQGKIDSLANETAASSFATQSEMMAQYRKKLDKPYFDKLFVAIDKEGNEIASNDITTPVAYIKAKYDFAVVGGVTMYATDKDLDIPSIYDGLPLDNDTIYWEEIKDEEGNVIGKRIKARGGSGEGGITPTLLGDLTNVGAWANGIATEDRIMVQRKDSTSWVALNLSEIGGGSADFSNVLSSGNGNAFTSFSLSEDKKILTLVKGQTFALQAELDKKWTTDSAKIANWNTAYGWGDHSKAGYLKKEVIYDESIGCWKFDGDLLVTGGITMFANDGTYTPSTIMDAINVDGTTIIKQNGVIMLNPDIEIGGGSGTDIDLSEYAKKATTLAGYGITDAKISNGVITLGGNTITPLTSHQTIYNLTLQAGKFSATTFDPNGGAKTVNIPTTTSHIIEDGNLYFTNERAVNAIANTLSSYVDTTLTDQTITKKKTFAEGCWVLAANESGVISNIHMHNSTWGNVSSPTLYGIRNGIGFAWQNTKWVVGNIRGNTTDSYGFGIGYHDGSKLSPSFRVTTGGSIYVNGGVYPNSNDASAVGSSAYQWSNIYAKKVTVDGIEMKKSSSGVLFLDANLVISGGVTMYGTDGTAAPTIWDNAPLATTDKDNKGVASFDPSYFSVSNGHVTFIGSTSGLDEYALANYLSSNKYLTQTDGDARYLLASDMTSLNVNVPITYLSNFKLGSLGTSNNIAIHHSNQFGVYGMVDYSSGAFALQAAYQITPTALDILLQPRGGNVAIGKTSATCALDVNGTIKGSSGSFSGSVSMGSAIINGGNLYYDSSEKYWKLEGDLLVTGGITMYGVDGSSFGTIWDNAPLATTDKDNKGVASFDPNYFSVNNGHVTFIGDVGGLDESALASYLSNNKYLTQTTGDARYLAIGGNAVSASGLSGLTPIISAANESNEISAVRNSYGAITTNAPTSGAAITNALKFRWYDTDWQIGNVRNMSNGTSGFGVTYGSSNLRFLVKTDGVETYGTLKTNGVIPASNGSYSLGSSSYKWTSVYATSFEGNATSATTASKLSTVSKTAWGQTYWTSGGVPTSISGDMTGVGSITMSGVLQMANGKAIKLANTSGVYKGIMSMSGSNEFCIGYDSSASSYDTYVDGFNMHFRTSSSHSEIFTLGSDGSAKLYLKTAALIIKRNHSSGGAYTKYRPCNQENQSWSAGVNNSYQYSWWYQNVSSGIDVQKMYLDSSGNLLTTGGVTMYSDLRKKTILNHVELSLKEVADAPLIEHYYNSDEKKTTHVGSVAQYWAGLNDWFCKEDGEGFLTMEIQNAALASAISVARELTRYESKTDKQIKKLKKRIGELEEEIENLKNK